MECTRHAAAWLAMAVAIITNTGHAVTFDPQTQPLDFVAPVALSRTGLPQGTTLFQPGFDAVGWNGDLQAFSIDPIDGHPAEQLWSAAAQLTARDWRERILVTRRDDTGQPVTFRTLADLSPNQQTLLGDQATLDYLRGDPDLEGTRFRLRVHSNDDGTIVRNILGPIIRSNPVYANIGGQGRVYVGANDGMLHAFDGDGGEVFAYVPSRVYRHLATLATSANDARPPYTVDGGLTLGKVRFHDGTTHTLLIGTLGGGGQGLFALDIGKPDVRGAADAMNMLLWEFDDRDDNALGYTYDAPQLVRLNDNRWAVLTGNGYSNNSADEHVGNGTAQLLIIDAERGSLIRRIDTNAGDAGNANGLSMPRGIDSDGDGRVDFAYAGDLLGNVWRFDLRGTDSAGWRVSCNSTALFTARDSSGNSQAITSAPAIVAHPAQGVRVLFGTGHTLTDADLDPVSGAQLNSLYGIWDRLEETCPAPIHRLQQTITEHLDSGGQRVRSSSHAVTDGGHDVWCVDLPAGERVTTDPQLSDGHLMLTTMQPLRDAGEVWLLEIDSQDGGAPAQTVFDMNNDGALNAQDNLEGSDAAENRISGRYYGTGLGSAPVTGNLNATRHVTYVNRAAAATPRKPSCTGDCGAGLLGDNTGDASGGADGASDGDGKLDPPTSLIDMAPACGVSSCIAEIRLNRGRVSWKELQAE